MVQVWVFTYNFYKKYTIGGNANYNDLASKNSDDVFITGFNTPNWITNVSFGSREIVKKCRFQYCLEMAEFICLE